MRLLAIATAAACLLASPAFAGAIPVPEPSVLTLLGSAAVGALLLYRLRRGR